ncbi:MAG: GNAT family N-acetyltransferase [Calditrichaceae bacterium]
MKNFINKINVVFRMIAGGQFGILFHEVRRRFYSNEESYCLRRDLKVPFNGPKAKIDIMVRPYQESDFQTFFELHTPDLTPEGIKERGGRILLLNSKAKTCYVAVTHDGNPAYMQWLMGPEENPKLQNLYKGGFPVLGKGEMLLEGAFTHESYRGQRIMPDAMSQIAEKGADHGGRYILTFVRTDNIPSLKGCQRSGFFPYQIRKDRWRFFTRSLNFITLPEGTPYPYEQENGPGDKAILKQA